MDDLGDIISGALTGITSGIAAAAPSIVGYFAQQQQIKAISKIQKNAYPVLPRLGMGVAGVPIRGGQFTNAPGFSFGSNSGVYTGADAVLDPNAMGGVGTVPYGPALPPGMGGGSMGINDILNAVGMGPNTSPLGSLLGYTQTPTGAVARARAPSSWATTDPVGRAVMVRSLGRPLLWSGDLAAAKRVRRIAGKLGRFVHHRHPR